MAPLGLAQLVRRSPAALPGGTRPEAIPPSAAPRKNGVRTDEMAKAAPKTRRTPSRTDAPRKAKLAPRSTMPSAARVNGMNSVESTAEKPEGKAVQNTTRVKINHTWLASHTGPEGAVHEGRRPGPRRGSPGNRVPEPGAEARPAERRLEHPADPREAGAGFGLAHGAGFGWGGSGGGRGRWGARRP